MVTRSSRSFHKACIWSRPLGWQVVHGRLHIDSLDYHCELLAAWLRFFQFETLSSEGNENGRKKQTNKQTNSKKSNWQKKKTTTLHVQHTFIVHFLICRCFARLQRETSSNVLVTRFMKEVSYVFFFTCSFFHCRSFSP